MCQSFRIAFFIAISMLAHELFAAKLGISPVTILFQPGQTIQTIKLSNDDVEPTVLQLEIKHWGQDDTGKDIYTSTQDLLVTPPLFTLAPGQSQLVRIALLKPFNNAQEATYRLSMREVVNPQQSTLKNQLQITLQTLLSIFIESSKKTSPVYHCAVSQISSKQFALSVANAGVKHILIIGIKVFDQNHQEIFEEKPFFAYLLAGVSRTFYFDTELPIPDNASVELNLSN